MRSPLFAGLSNAGFDTISGGPGSDVLADPLAERDEFFMFDVNDILNMI